MEALKLYLKLNIITMDASSWNYSILLFGSEILRKENGYQDDVIVQMVKKPGDTVRLVWEFQNRIRPNKFNFGPTWFGWIS